MTSERVFSKRWTPHVDNIEAGLKVARRSSRISLLPHLVIGDGRHISLKFDVVGPRPDMDITVLNLHPQKPKLEFKVATDGAVDAINEAGMVLPAGAATVFFDGVRLAVKAAGHSAYISTINEREGFASKITLSLDSAALAPVLAESSLLRSVQRNMSALEVLAESAEFAATAGDAIVVADDAAGAFLELYYENTQPGRDALWQATLLIANRFRPDDTRGAVTHVTHAPFMVAQVLPPRFEPEAGTILGQWNSNDPEGAQWRFAVDTVSMRMPPQAVGEAMVRGDRFAEAGHDPASEGAPVHSRFARSTDLTVRPSRRTRRYTVHPGDILSVLQDAQLERLVTEVAYPLEVTYQRTPESKHTVLVAELGKRLGEPAISLPSASGGNWSRALHESMSATLAAWYLATDPAQQDAIRKAYGTLRQRHLANRATFRHRVAQFPLSDAAHPDRKLDLGEGLSARLRGKGGNGEAGEGAAAVYPVPVGTDLSREAVAALQAFVPDGYGTPGWEDAAARARALPIGLVNTIEFASELRAVLGTPVTGEVRLIDLTLSALGATGAMKAAFDEGRTVFEVQCADGQQSRMVKTRVGRIGVAWNRAIHVVVYERSTVPGAQFQGEQPRLIGRPLVRKMEEYIEILEPQRLFAAEGAATGNRPGCVHSFGFATRRIYVNGAWGRDVGTHGYEVPLFNPDDKSGFYSKPWLGPVAESGGDEVVRHWHEHPEHVYFYSNTEPGAGADSDAWDARADVDFDSSPGLGNIAAGARAPGPDNLRHQTVPTYTLDAAANPRFAMQVVPDGPSNIAHGRGKDRLVAALRTIQVERTGATSRLGFDAGGLIQQVVPAAHLEALWVSARGAADVRSVEATIARIVQDADALRDGFASADALLQGCVAFRSKLEQRIAASFAEARGRLDKPLADALGAIDQAALDKLVQQQKDSLVQALAAGLAMPLTMLRAAFADADRVIAGMRARLALMGDTVDAGSANIMARLDDDAIAMGLRALFERHATAIDAPAELIASAKQSLVAARDDLVGRSQIITGDAATACDELEAIVNGDIDELKAKAIAWLLAAEEEGRHHLGQLTEAAAAVRAFRLPASLRGLGGVQENCVRIAGEAQQALALLVRTFAAVREAIAGLDPQAARDKLNQEVLAPYRAWIAAFAAATQDAAAAIDTVAGKLAPAEAALRHFAAEVRACAFLAPAEATLGRLRTQVGTIGASLTQVVGEADAALEALRSQVASAGANADAALVSLHDAARDAVVAAVTAAANDLVATLAQLQQQVKTGLTKSATAVREQLAAREEQLLKQVRKLDCAAWDKLRGDIKATVDEMVGTVRDRVAETAARLLDEDTRRQVERLKETVADAVEASAGVRAAYEAYAPKASQAIKLVKLLSEPPELPQITINSERLEYVFDDVKNQIETSPFVARLRELDAGIKELGIAIPSRQILDRMVPDELQGAKFNDIVRQVGIDFEDFFKKFRLPSLPSDAIKFSHHVDPKKRTASAKAEIDHEFKSTEQLFDIASFSLDVRKPRVQASANFEIAESEAGRAQTSARFGGDWILNFGGQPLVTFHGANVQYSDSGGFKFDLDPTKIEPHPALAFISTAFKAKMPKLPEGVKIIKDDQGRPVGAKIEQKNDIGPFDLGPLFIGETVLASGFGLLIESGRMKLDASFNIGDVGSPVFMQIGIYGGGGWLKTRAWLDVDSGGKLVPAYSASIGVSLGSARAFTLASVATGSYAMRIFVEAAFASRGGNSFVAGLSVSGSARILGYLNAYLLLLLQVEHKDGGSMKGTGRLDVEIEVCWCYSVRISRTVEQNM